MKVALHSDLHFEFTGSFDRKFLSDQSFDVLVLAGDIGTFYTIDDAFEEIRSLTDKHVVYVAGNHDYYGGPFDRDYLKSVCKLYGIHMLDRGNSFIFDDVAFIGCTGWSTMDSVNGFRDPKDILTMSMHANDFKEIDDFTINDMMREGELDRDWLNAELEKYSHKKRIVVTHFCPLVEAGNSKYPFSGTTANYFMNNYTNEILEHMPDYWLFGHTHHRFDRQFFHTRVLSNQRGYPREFGKLNYDANFIFEV